METINKERIELEVQGLKEQAELAERNYKVLSQVADKYSAITFSILKRRGIRVEKSQMYFNNSIFQSTPNYKRALIHIQFVRPLDSRKAKHLERTLRDAEIPLTVGSCIYSVSISLEG